MLEISLHFGGLRIVDILDPEHDDKRLKQLGYPIKDHSSAYLCVAEVCVPATKNKLPKAIQTINNVAHPLIEWVAFTELCHQGRGLGRRDESKWHSQSALCSENLDCVL